MFEWATFCAQLGQLASLAAQVGHILFSTGPRFVTGMPTKKRYASAVPYTHVTDGHMRCDDRKMRNYYFRICCVQSHDTVRYSVVAHRTVRTWSGPTLIGYLRICYSLPSFFICYLS
jgi:hypothetical protein